MKKEEFVDRFKKSIQSLRDTFVAASGEEDVINVMKPVDSGMDRSGERFFQFVDKLYLDYGVSADAAVSIFAIIFELQNAMGIISSNGLAAGYVLEDYLEYLMSKARLYWQNCFADYERLHKIFWDLKLKDRYYGQMISRVMSYIDAFGIVCMGEEGEKSYLQDVYGEMLGVGDVYEDPDFEGYDEDEMTGEGDEEDMDSYDPTDTHPIHDYISRIETPNMDERFTEDSFDDDEGYSVVAAKELPSADDGVLEGVYELKFGGPVLPKDMTEKELEKMGAEIRDAALSVLNKHIDAHNKGSKFPRS